MKKSELQSLIKEEIRNILKEGSAQAYTFSGTKGFMSRVAVPVFRNNGINTAKLSKEYDADSGTVEVTVTIDPAIAEKIGNELEKSSRAKSEYGGYFEADDELQELFGFGATKLKVGDKINLTVKAKFNDRDPNTNEPYRPMYEYELVVKSRSENQAKVEVVKGPSKVSNFDNVRYPQDMWLQNDEMGKDTESTWEIDDYVKRLYGTIQKMSVNGKETKKVSWEGK